MSQGDDSETLLLFLLFTGALLQKLWVGGGDSGVVAHVILESALSPYFGQGLELGLGHDNWVYVQ